MSTVETKKIEKTYTFFDENFQLVSKTVTIEFTEPKDIKEAYDRIGNDEKKLLKALTSQLRRDELAKKEAEVKGAGISSAAVMTVLRPFREIPPYKDMDRAEQTKALLAKVNENPLMKEAMKAQAAALEASGNEESEN